MKLEKYNDLQHTMHMNQNHDDFERLKYNSARERERE